MVEAAQQPRQGAGLLGQPLADLMRLQALVQRLGQPLHQIRHATVVRCEGRRSEEHTSELQSLMRISYAVFCLKKKKNRNTQHNKTQKSTLHQPQHITHKYTKPYQRLLYIHTRINT